jgi:Fe-S-cluster-containing dehydrogenase component
MKSLAFSPELCDGARGCELVCAETWFHVPDSEKSSLKIGARSTPEGARGFSAEFCIQCGACVPVCPVNALVQLKNGVVHVRRQDCIGCMACVGFCPYDVMYFDTDEVVAFKCVACGQCVKICPTGALKIVDVPEASLDLWNGAAWAQAEEVNL